MKFQTGLLILAEAGRAVYIASVAAKAISGMQEKVIRNGMLQPRRLD